MYTIALIIALTILLEAVMTVLNSVLKTVGVGDAIAKLPIIGSNLTLIIAIVGAALLGDWGMVLAGWGWAHDTEWVNWVANGAVVAGAVPLKDAIFAAVGKGLRA